MVETPRSRRPSPTRTADETEADAREKFVRLYGPVVYGYARKRGLGNADAVLVMSEVLRGMARNDGGPDGALDSRLFALSWRTISTVTSTRGNRPFRSGNGGSKVDPVTENAETPDAEWEEEVTRRLVAEAMNRVESEFPSLTWKAFWMTTVEGRPAHAVGRQLRMISGAVWVARCRVLARLGEEVQCLRAESEGRPWGES